MLGNTYLSIPASTVVAALQLYLSEKVFSGTCPQTVLTVKLNPRKPYADSDDPDTYTVELSDTIHLEGK